MHRIGWIVVLAAAVGLAACDDPTRVLDAPTDLDRSMKLVGVLNPDSSSQPLWIETADVARDVGPDQTTIEGVAATVSVAGDTLLRAVPLDTAPAHDRLDPCSYRYGSLGINSANACIVLDFRPVPGETYTLTVTASGRPTATATTRIPGRFEICAATAAGLPPGTDGLSVRWSESAGAHRYFVGMSSDTVSCQNVNGCLDIWYASTGRTELDATVPEHALRDGEGAWWVNVYALDRALFEYLTTGTGESFFAVSPVSNVEGGYGVVGAWVRRSRAVEL